MRQPPGFCSGAGLLAIKRTQKGAGSMKCRGCPAFHHYSAALGFATLLYFNNLRQPSIGPGFENRSVQGRHPSTGEAIVQADVTATARGITPTTTTSRPPNIRYRDTRHPGTGSWSCSSAHLCQRRFCMPVISIIFHPENFDGTVVLFTRNQTKWLGCASMIFC